ncbi:hypothetical protein K443DRAFT_9053 [Laccaria amethystina LaAM-08-1]|uniref:Uncharacterized protein n=1 Tax=Laccaria amethystina LaAM-08-1 TaxID=1095629 RepID=A0A0C9XRR4_9AGAR|nr:hypothetical protein K443DRAFT_9053 [Laccaria amethystina LaAM-08-1]
MPGTGKGDKDKGNRPASVLPQAQHRGRTESSCSRSPAKRAPAYGTLGVAGGVGHPAAVGEGVGEGGGVKVAGVKEKDRARRFMENVRICLVGGGHRRKKSGGSGGGELIAGGGVSAVAPPLKHKSNDSTPDLHATANGNGYPEQRATN